MFSLFQMFHNQPDPVELVSLPTSQDESTFSGNGGGTCIKKGLMWQQRDRLFSRWKERYFVLSKDYLQCYKRGSSRISEMGGFIFKIKLSEVYNEQLCYILSVGLILHSRWRRRSRIFFFLSHDPETRVPFTKFLRESQYRSNFYSRSRMLNYWINVGISLCR